MLVRSTLALCNFPIRSYPVGGGGVLGANWPFYITKDLMKNVSCSFCKGCCNWRKLYSIYLAMIVYSCVCIGI